MSTEFERNLDKYAEVILKVGLNLQPNQCLLIGAPNIAHDGIPFEAAPLVRIITKKAYQMGARLVDVIWADEQIRLIRLQNSPKKFLREYPRWKMDAVLNNSKEGGAFLTILSPNPDLLKDVDRSSIVKYQLFFAKHYQPVSRYNRQNPPNWSAFSVPNKAWSDKLFPDIPSNERIQKLWDVIFEICRISDDDPISGWQIHNENLSKRCNYLNQKQYKELKLKSPETNLIIGLPKDHIWQGGTIKSHKGIIFTPNLPTEEIFTLPDKDRVNGFVKTTKKFIIEGQIIEEAIFHFSEGRIIKANAKIGEDIVNIIINVDEGARRMGEIALVPHSSPISKMNMLFYNLLIDENASNHIAIGTAIRSSLKNGNKMTEEEFISAGG
ncbi:MAG: aminopeptidase, partial [Promethearchaeota archaeon]